MLSLSSEMEWIDLDGSGKCWLGYQRNYIADHQQLYAHCVDQLDWERPRIKLFGREIAVPRQVAFYGDRGVSYGYSGQRHAASPWPAELLHLRERLQAELESAFNCVLVNWYRDGRDSMGYHSDDEAELGAEPCIASVSLGAERRFTLRRRDRSADRELRLEGGSLLVMAGAIQRFWQHALPREKRVTAGRINLTYRQVTLTR